MSGTTFDPSIGRIVRLRMEEEEEGAPAFYLPMIITHVHSKKRVSGVVFSATPSLDGLESHGCDAAVHNAKLGDEVGQWSWPPRV